MIPANHMRNPETPTGLPQGREDFKTLKEHIVVLMPLGRDYGVSETAWLQIRTHPDHMVICKDNTGKTLATIKADAFAQLEPSSVLRIERRTLYMIPRTSCE